MTRTITALRRERTGRKRVHVLLDDESSFSLGELVAAGLGVGQTLEDDEIAALRQRDEAESAQDRALGLLEHRPRSRAELVRRLRRAGFTVEATEAAVGRLEGVDLVDDEAFARFWVEQRLTFRPRSLKALRFELRQQGLNSEVIDRVLADIDDAQLAADVVERHLQGLENRRSRALGLATGEPSEPDAVGLRQALYKLLRSRGFDYRTIRNTLADLDELETGPASADDTVEEE